MNDGLINALKVHINDLNNDTGTSADFQRFFSTSVSLNNLTYEQIAKQFSISKQTADRWKNGKAAPVPGYRGVILRGMRVLAQKRLNDVTGQSESLETKIRNFCRKLYHKNRGTNED